MAGLQVNEFSWKLVRRTEICERRRRLTLRFRNPCRRTVRETSLKQPGRKLVNCFNGLAENTGLSVVELYQSPKQFQQFGEFVVVLLHSRFPPVLGRSLGKVAEI
jgi:hypothetical protein